MTGNLADDVVCNFFRRDILHQTKCGERFKLAETKEAIFARIQEHASERLPRFFVLRAAIDKRLIERNRFGCINALDLLTAAMNGPMRDSLPADCRSRLDLFDRGRSGSAGHEI